MQWVDEREPSPIFEHETFLKKKVGDELKWKAERKQEYFAPDESSKAPNEANLDLLKEKEHGTSNGVERQGVARNEYKLLWKFRR